MPRVSKARHKGELTDGTSGIPSQVRPLMMVVRDATSPLEMDATPTDAIVTASLRTLIEGRE